MIVLHNTNDQASIQFVAAHCAGLAVIDWYGDDTAREAYLADSGNPAPSAFPTVVVDIPAYTETLPSYGDNGELLGVVTVSVPAHREALRLPASMAAVEQYLAYVEARAAANPPE